MDDHKKQLMNKPHMNVAFVGKVGRKNLVWHLIPIQLLPYIDKIAVIRHQALDENLPKLEYVLFKDRGLLANAFAMLSKAISYVWRQHPSWIVTFHMTPWGLVAWLAAKVTRTPISMGLIGDDFERDVKGRLSPLWLLILRHCEAVTVTGQSTRQYLIEHGLLPASIHVLPHAIDLDLFNDTDRKKIYDVICVGELIPRKQFHLVIQAFHDVLKMYPDARLAIIGDGPEKERLLKQVDELDLADNVDFQGYQSNVQEYLQQSKIIALPSINEGFPFVTVEAICCGVVPVCTAVGTATDWLTDEQNAFFVPMDNAQALATRIKTLLSDSQRLESMREECLKLRPQFAFDEAAKVWDTIFGNKHFNSRT